jgi:hypothetical protein
LSTSNPSIAVKDTNVGGGGVGVLIRRAIFASLTVQQQNISTEMYVSKPILPCN